MKPAKVYVLTFAHSGHVEVYATLKAARAAAIEDGRYPVSAKVGAQTDFYADKEDKKNMENRHCTLHASEVSK